MSVNLEENNSAKTGDGAPCPFALGSAAGGEKVSGPSTRRPRVWPAQLAQDGHSFAQQAIYLAMWGAGKPEGDGNRILTLGLGRLAKLARLSESTCRLGVRSLVQKLAVEEIASERSAEAVGKTYRILAYKEILARRRAAGLRWVIRGKGVRFVRSDGSELSLSAPPKYPFKPESVSMTAHSIGSAKDAEIAAQSGSGFFESTSEADAPAQALEAHETVAVIGTLAKLGIAADDDVAHQIITGCRAADRTATLEEIAHFVELKVGQLAHRKRAIKNWSGMLITAVPKYFISPATELGRYRAQKACERQREEEIARTILKDPSSSDSDRQWAGSVLNVSGTARDSNESTPAGEVAKEILKDLFDGETAS